MINSPMTFREIMNAIGGFVSGKIMPLLVAVAIIIFLWNLIHFIANAGNERERTTFKNYMINALIALFILVSMWGIVGLGTRTLFGSKPFIPQLPTSDSQ